MDDATARALNALSLEFYRSHAAEFSAKRKRPWPGWSTLLDWIPKGPLRVLDVGCGNARFGRFLAAHRSLCHYSGVDASRPLLEIARQDPPLAQRVDWSEADFVATPPDDALPRQLFDLVVLFGVLHGVAGEARRRLLLEACSRRLDAGGLLVFTCWGFSADPRIAGRIAAGEHLPRGVDARALGPHDHLVPWGEGGSSFRYARDVGAAERRRLLADLPLEPVHAYQADGPEGTHNHYSVMRRSCSSRRRNLRGSSDPPGNAG